MATDYVGELGDNRYLPQEGRDAFYHKLKHTVVVTKVTGFPRGTSLGGGMWVSPDGLVLTALNHIGTKPTDLSLKWFSNSKFSYAELLHYDAKLDLALLRLKRKSEVESAEAPPHALHYVDFCPASEIRVGKEAICIAHTSRFEYSITFGQVAYPTSTAAESCPSTSNLQSSIHRRTVLDCRDELGTSLQPWQHCKSDLHLIQVNNIHGGPEATGSPVFSSSGLVMGMRIFSYAGFDFCVHVDTLQKFIEEFKEKDEANSLLSVKPKLTSKDLSKRQKGVGKRTSLTEPKCMGGNSARQTGNSTHRREGSEKKSDGSCLEKYCEKAFTNLLSVRDGSSAEGTISRINIGLDFSTHLKSASVSEPVDTTRIVDKSRSQKCMSVVLRELKQYAQADDGNQMLLKKSMKDVYKITGTEKIDKSVRSRVRVPLSGLSGQTMAINTVKNISQNPFLATAAKKVLQNISMEKQDSSLKNRSEKSSIKASDFITKTSSDLAQTYMQHAEKDERDEGIAGLWCRNVKASNSL